jgi:chemotaxis protein methyltransferase CheR
VDDIASGIVALRTPTAKHVPTTARAHAADGIGGSATTHLPGHEFGPNCVDPARMERDLTKEEFRRYHDYLYAKTGIHYPDEKIELLSNRIRKRLRGSRTDSYDAYLQKIAQPHEAAELQSFLDSITTNETYFFRCQRHWDFFRQWLEQRAASSRRREPLRIWSAAASTGAEAYTIAIVLQQVLGSGFGGTQVEVFGTDLSQHVLDEARRATFRPYALAQTPKDVVQRFFTRNDKDEYVFDRALAKCVTFQRHNLMEPLAGQRPFEFVFLRNVMIYFDTQSRERVLGHVLQVTAPGGHLVVGESESLLNVKHGFHYVKPSIFVRQTVPGGAPGAGTGAGASPAAKPAR